MREAPSEAPRGRRLAGGRANEARLVLEDGTVFEGAGFGAAPDEPAAGEVVFNTGMTGYQEVLTDPSYRGQIVTMTYPHIGNYGVNGADTESSRPHVAGFVIRDLPPVWSSWRGQQGLDEYLTACGVPGIAEIDTRRLTRHLRSRGAMRGAIAPAGAEPEGVVERLRSMPSMVGADFVREVTARAPYEWPMPEGTEVRWRVAAYDFGIKTSILRRLACHGCAVTVYPASTPAGEVLAAGPDGVFLSNGPGDPEAVRYGIAAISELLGRVPVFGICLGHQLLGLALGLPTFKLPFGHHGANHPVARLADGRVEITTQNHGFAVAAEPFHFEAPPMLGVGPGRALPTELEASSPHGALRLTHLNLNDHTVEGFRLIDEPAFAVQYHPEAGPGPHDARYLFEDFCALMGPARG
ncbi:MAG TPA: glutamine-hydrolyzing carbamoyl-phosphate synthase small subunit [Actinomycetota bacterium]|nr:glutamine-hydrolyzing carbamoyl-phosphate synthase small subunit [Actinomycetota bacterium]